MQHARPLRLHVSAASLTGPCKRPAGLPIAFMSGFCVAASRLGAPDAGLLSYGEILHQGRHVVEATRALPIIGDADTG